MVGKRELALLRSLFAFLFPLLFFLTFSIFSVDPLFDFRFLISAITVFFHFLVCIHKKNP